MGIHVSVLSKNGVGQSRKVPSRAEMKLKQTKNRQDIS